MLVVYGSDLVRQIPMAALVAVMIMVSIGTFSWRSLRDLRTHPRSSSAVMLLTVVVTVATHDLAKGVLSGVLLSRLFFARKVGRMLDVQREMSQTRRSTAYAGRCSSRPPASWAPRSTTSMWRLRCRSTCVMPICDLTAVAALERAQKSWPRMGRVTVVGLNAASQTLIEQVGGRGGGH